MSSLIANDNQPIHKYLRETLAQVLDSDLARAGDDLPLVELGLDSVPCAAWVRLIAQQYGVALSVAEVCECGTLRAVGQRVNAALASRATAGEGRAADEVLACVRHSLAVELDRPEADLEDDTPFLELGLDSITGVTWTRKLNTHFKLSLSVAKVYSHPTLRALAAHIAVSTAKLIPGVAGQEPNGKAPVHAGKAEAAPAPAPAQPGDAVPGDAVAPVAAVLRRLLAQELDADERGIDDAMPFLELGLDSITGVTWMRKINTRFGLALSVAKVYSHSTIAGLAAFIVQQGVSAGPPEATQRPAAAPGARAAPASPASQAGPPALQAAPGPALFAQAPPVPAGIAVIGMSGQFPMADDLEAFWQNILQRKDCVSEVPASRWRIDRHFQSGAPRPGKSYSKWMGVLDRAAEFDPLFFNISPAEAQFMDPQQRLVLQQSWHCIEDAGGDPDRLAGTACGVFLGCSSNGYGEQVDERDWNAHQNLGSNSAILASRIAYFLNLRGPCLSIDTSCSSSLVAIASACDSLLLGESEVALAGGVWVIPGPGVHVAMSQLNALSPDGRCRAFDDRANGFVPAEGVGFLMLKRLSDAQRDGDRIHAVIAGWGVNQDGKSNGITAPNGDAQAALQERVYRRFGIDLADIDLVEAHGTGTSLGDPVEVDALTASFRRFTPRVGDCALGSVKSNIGHTASAAGVASALKVILALKHRVLPPTALFERMNPHIDLSSTPFRVQAGPAPWAGRGRPRMGVVNSFGYSGTNAHLVIAEAPLQPPMQAPQGECLVVLSARTAAQLKEQAQRLSAHLERHADVALGDLAHTLLHGRKHWRHRLAVVAGDLAQLQRSLRAWLDQGSDPAVCQGEAQPGQSGAAVETPGLSEAAQQYVRGASLRWEALFPHGRQRLLSLPGYPFSRERHWLPLHPLLHRDESTASQARFSATFDGTESFLDHHRVQGEKVLPGAAYLEMAREAVARVHGEEAVARMQLQDLVWLRPATCRAGLELAATLTPQAEGLLGFEVTAQGGEGQPLLLCQARVRLDAGVMPRPVDLQALRERCREPLMPAEDFYALYAAAGMAYGPAHRSVVRLLQGRGAQGQPEVLAEIALPATVQGHRHGLHPSLVDGALQATVCLGWTAQSPAASQPALPFALGGLQVLGATPSRVYAWIRPSTAGRVSGAVHKLDISLCDEQGRLCAELSGLSVRALARGEQPATGPTPVSRAAVPVAAAPQVATASGAPRPAQVGDRALHYFRQQLAVALKLSVGELDVDAPMERYGMDSIMAMELTRHLEESFGPLPKTLFFEVQTPRALAEYFVAEHPQVLQQLLGEGVPVEPPALPAGPVEWPDTSVPAPQAAWTSPAPAGHADIAVVGIGGRYPQAPTLQQFWENLRSGRDCITEVPAERWDHGLYFDPDKGAAGKSYCKWGGFIEGVDEFDPLFFNISPREAEYLDPQERLFLQCVHETLEDAGYTGESLGRQSRQAGASQLHRVGVFVGVMYEEYQLYGAQAQARGQAVALAGSPSSIANRISYFFNFHGPSMAVDTMCSSSLTSIHLACMAIRSGQCDAAIAGGVNVTVHPNKYLMLSQGRFASSLGRCGSFGAGGDGYVPGEGVGALLLKPRERALADGDHILGVIRGSALNHGGKTNGVSVPSLVAQGQVIAAALREAGVSPAELSYIEAHGTGTSLGDPIEIAGLMKVFQPAGAGQPAQRCAIGSVKSSIGHCESAAGVAGVTKVLLQMQHRQLVPSLHSQTLNPHIDFDRTPFAVQQQLQPWEPPVRIGEDGQPVACRRIAGVSSFGAGGSNAHVIIEEHVEDPSEAGRRARWQGRPAAIVLSAQDARALVERARRLLARLPDLPGDALHDLAFTLQVGRDAMKERLAFVVGSLQELAARLQAFVDEPQRIQGIAAAWRGTAEAGHEAWSAFAGDEELQEAVHKWLQRGKYEKLLNLWVQGLRVDWLQLYGPDAGMRRLSLPGYPFAKERCWFEAATAGAPSTAAAAVLHPLLHRNDSTAFELRFSSTFDGSEPFLRDHVVNGQRVLPGVAHLEM
ncbi:MAG: polyketide synthase dehydratase domain-containing protein, partial [Burkholderiales bacterium]|nr:polyketide synthase dehydratase domain-containing protein [Burkholderiales bacterium]